MGLEIFDQKIFNSNIFYYNVNLNAGVFYITVDLLSDVNNATINSIPKIGDGVTFDLYGIHIVGQVSQVDKGRIYTENNNTTVIDFSPGKATPFRFGEQFVNPQYAYSVTIYSNTNLLNNYFDSTINSNIRNFQFTDGIDYVRTVSATCETLESALNSFPTSYSLSLDSDNYINNLTITGRRDNPAGILYYLKSSEPRNKITIPTKAFGTTSTVSVSTTSTTTTAVPSSPPVTTSTNPTVAIPVYPVKYFGCYVSNFDGYLTTNGDGKLNIYLYEDPSAGLTFQAPIINSDFTFIFDGMVFKGVVTKYQELTNSITPDIKKYFVEIACYEGTSNFSDQIFNNDVITFNFSVASSNIRLDTNSSDINIIAYLNTASNPSTEYGSHFAWNSSSAKYFSIGDIQYTGSKPYESLYQITGNKSIYLTQTVVKSATSTPSNPASTGGTLSTTSSNGTSITSSTNDFGAGTTTTTAPNSTNEPIGETTTYVTTGGFTTQTTRMVTATEVVVTTNSTFNAVPNNSQFAANQRKSANIPKNFNGSVDPISMYPSMEIYPSGSYTGKESGRYFGNSASPTSFDLDPYFYFTTNDFNLVAKDGKSNTKNVNVKKDSIKNHVRTMGLKGPMLLSGWGYDVRGLPVPNSSGLIPSGEYKFHPKASTQRGFWKTGPIDLRWHGKKKTWVGGQEMLEGYLLEDLSSAPSISGTATAKMSVLRAATPSGLTGQKLLTQSSGILRDDKGNQTGVRPAIYDHEYITITNRDPSLSASSGTYCIALDINYEWRPIYIGC